jgi:hypothetical protein
MRIPALDHGIAEEAEPSLVAQTLEGWNLMTEVVAKTDLPWPASRQAGMLTGLP